ncbi:hypothetical protein MKZ38_002415 [Zalerion maritima]|uniref:Ribosome maturation protein SDO1/SBDS N-terminal domain-containing protein n=1 Tax=Zalerion maritima TaxID=339359 RepID=A0AAD5WT57_9PEZI|nr:hypothetical protein MKZ38_002415 [Zalerion maritima]
MTRGEATQYKVHYKGPETENDFIIFVEDREALNKWREDTSVPLAHVVQSFKVFTTHQQGASGALDGASKQILETEFGTSVDEEVIKTILQKGDVKEMEGHARNGSMNDSRGGYAATR